MKALYVLCLCCAVVLPALVLGCDRSEKAPVLEQSEPAAAKLERLPELGDPIGPLDKGRIEVAPPKGWHVPLRDPNWIARFTALQGGSYPSIFLTAEDYGDVRDVSQANVDAFARQLSAALSADEKTAKLARGIEPVKIGSLVGISYLRRGKTQDRFKEIVLERLFVETVVAGRKYKLELRTRAGTLDEFRPCLLAVAGGMKFFETAKAVGTGGESDADESGSDKSRGESSNKEPE